MLISSLLLFPLFFAITPDARAESTVSFSDVPPSHPAFAAVEELKERGILQGYEDGTFRPGTTVNRAEAVKIVVAPLVSEDDLAQYTSSQFTDIPAGTWYLPFVEAARVQLSVIDGPPTMTSFHSTRPVSLAEFLKILELSQNVDPVGTLSEVTFPLASDVTDARDWSYPYLRFALLSSLLFPAPDGTLQPSKELTRGEVAVLLHRLLLYKEGRRTQALLSETESELNSTRALLNANLAEAYFASARALLAARGALLSNPDDPVAKSAVKTAEGFRAIVDAYDIDAGRDPRQIIELASSAWHLAEKARSFSDSFDALALEVQTLAKNMADEARAGMGG